MITPTQQIVCSIVSRQLVADLSPASRQRVADQSQPISNQLAINRPLVADRSPTGRRFLPEASFGLRVLSLPACVCVCVCVCVCLCVRQSWACPSDNLSTVQARITKFGPEMQNTLV